MKFVIAFALFAAASASIIPPSVVASTNPEVQEILAAIQNPATDPATAAALEQMLLEVLGVAKPEPIHVGPAIVDSEPIHVGPAIIDGYEPIHVGPAIVDSEPIHVGPAIIDGYEPIHVGPAIVDNYEPIHVGPAIVQPSPVASPSPLVQIILNVQSSSDVAIDSVPSPAPTPVQVVDEAEAPEPIIVVDKPEPLPVITLPETIN
ncbi:actin cytoskeleton-regulatory complex protein PAN1-like [Papilio machaon]|nr:actin cytoskeleton-regulatory complex protein PAN1-like [Papilio machaon]